MNRKNELNLASLHEQQEEISENEMKEVTGGVTECDCFGTTISLDSYDVEVLRSCSCGSVWVIFGLSYG